MKKVLCALVFLVSFGSHLPARADGTPGGPIIVIVPDPDPSGSGDPGGPIIVVQPEP